MASGIVLRYTLDTTPLRRIAEVFRRTGTDPKGLLEIWGGTLEGNTRNRFDTGRGVGGVPWPPSKRVQRHGGKTLVDRGNLERSVHYVVRSNVVYVGVGGGSQSTRAAPALQFGSRRQTVVVRHTRTQTSAFGVPLPRPVTVTVRGHGRMTNLPARPFIGIDAQDLSDLRAVSVPYLRGLLR